MILVDFSAIMFANLHADMKGGGTPNATYIRHLCANTLRIINQKFRFQYGEMVLAYDSKSWRDGIFPQYKYVRRKERASNEKEAKVWEKIFDMFQEIQQEFTDNMMYGTVEGLGAEGDDIIGVLCRDPQEKILIVSNDKDFGGLTAHPLIEQFRPITQSMYTVDDPDRALFELILSGDRTDGIPNIRCSDDFFVDQYKWKLENEGVRAKPAPPISAKMKQVYWEAKQNGTLAEVLPEEYHRNYKRNCMLVDLDNIPKIVVDNIWISFNNRKHNSEAKMTEYFRQHKMTLLMQHIQDFRPKQLKQTVF